MNRVKLHFLILTCLILAISNAGASDILDAPYSTYVVNERGVNKISVIGDKDKDGNYKVTFRNITSIYSFIKKGDITAKGWWHPSLQQFITQNNLIVPAAPHCNIVAKKKWGYKYSPTTLQISMKDVNGYNQIPDYTDDSVPSSSCRYAKINTQTCKLVRCTTWEPAETDSFLVRNRRNALTLFKQITR